MTSISNKTFDEIKVGDNSCMKRTLTKFDIELFAIVSGDVNPAHVDAEYAKKSMFHDVIAHGMWTGALISTVLGTQFPGPGTIYLAQNIKFLKPVYIGDEITVSVRVVKKYVRKPILVLTCVCTNQRNKNVATGFAKVMAPTQKITCKRMVMPKVTLSSQDNKINEN